MVFLFILLSVSAFIRVSLNADSSLVSQITNYSLNFETTSQIPQGGQIQLTFPSMFTTLTQGSKTCSISPLQPNCQPICEIIGLMLKVSGCFPATEDLVQCKFQQIQNPIYAKKSDSFQLRIVNSETVLDDWLQELTLTFFSRPLTQASISPVQQVAGSISDWNIFLTINYQIPSTGFIELVSPDWLEDSNQKYCEDSLSHTCTGEDINSNCSCTDGVLTVVVQENLIGEFSFVVTQMRNPPNTSSISGFQVNTGYLDGYIEESESIEIFVQVDHPGTLNIDSFIVSDLLVSAEAQYEFEVTCGLPIPENSAIDVFFPDDFEVNSDITISVQGVYGIVNQPTVEILDNSIFMTNAFTSLKNSESILIFTVNAVRNPITTTISSSIQILIHQNSEICQAIVGMQVQAQAGTFTDVQITPQQTQINANTIYQFQFTSNNNLPNRAGIKVTAPSQVSFTNSNKNSCLFVDVSSSLDQEALCQITEEKELYVTEGFPSGYTAGYVISWEIGGVINPMTIQETDTFLIQTFLNDSFEDVIGENSSVSVQATSGTLVKVEVSPSSSVTGEFSIYEFSVHTANAITSFGYIVVEFPQEIVIEDTNAGCVDYQGFLTEPECDLAQQEIVVLNGFQTDQDFPAGEVKFTVENIRNPRSTQVSGSFKVRTYTIDDLVLDQLTDGVTLTMEIPHQLQSASITSENDVVGETSDFIFTLDPYNPFPNNGVIQISPPDQITWPNTITCEGNSFTISSVSCALSGRTLQVTVQLNSQSTQSELSLILLDATNPSSTSPTSQFTITTLDGSYYIDTLSQDLTLQVFTPQTISVISITADDLGINKITTYYFTLTTINEIPANGSIQVQLPSQMTIQDNFICYHLSEIASCSNQGENTIKLQLFVQTFYPASLSFQIRNLQNSASAGASSKFTVTTLDRNGNPIDQNTQKIVAFECYSPCATCQTSPNSCLSCDPSSSQPYFYQNGCHQQCNSGFADIYSDYTCLACDQNCSECSGSVTTCTQCDQSSSLKFLYQNKCQQTCPTSTYTDQANTCIDCSSSCLSCQISSQICTGCQDQKFLYNSQCVDSCSQNGKLAIDSQCFDCAQNCNQCQNSPQNCIQCVQDYYLHNNSCVQECPLDTTLKIGQECIDCQVPCESCTGTVETCTACISGYSLYNQECLSICPVSYTSIQRVCQECSDECVTCSGQTDFCTSCPDDQVKSEGRCVNQCSEGEAVLIQDECIECLDSCATCENSIDFCTSCNNLELYNGQCLESCPQGTTSVFGECKGCQGNCLACSGTTSTCSSCQEGFYFYSDLCYSECPSGTIQEGELCVSCEEPCVTCQQTSTSCLTCQTSLVLFEGECLQSCPNGYQPSQGVCLDNSLNNICPDECTDQLLNNDVCDEQCNIIACGYDNQVCIPELEQEIKYDQELRLEESPFVFCSGAVLATVVVGVSKCLSSATAPFVATSSLLSLAGTASWGGVLYYVADSSSLHGRELLDTDQTEILTAFSLLICILTGFFVCNVIFIVVIFKVMVPNDSLFQVWKQERCCGFYTVISLCVFSFRIFRLFFSRLFGLEVFQANFARKKTLVKPLVYMSYISLGAIEVPLICVFVYILSVYSTGNIVFVVALDALILTCVIAIFSVIDIIRLNRELKKLKKPNQRTVEITTTFPQQETQQKTDPKNLIIENFKVFDFDKPFSAGFQTGRFQIPEPEIQVSSFQPTFAVPPLDITLADQEQFQDTHPILEQEQLIIPVQQEESQIIQQGLNQDSIQQINDQYQPQMLQVIPQESLLQLSDAQIDDYDPECIKVLHKLSGVTVLVKKDFLGSELENGQILNTSYEIHQIDKEDVRYAIIKRSNSDVMLRAKRNFSGSQIVDIQLRMLDRWLVGRYVRKQEDFDFDTAQIDPYDPEAVVATHQLTGYKFLIKKGFIGAVKVDQYSNKPLFGQQGVTLYENPEVDPNNVRFANLTVNGRKIRCKRSFIGAWILGVIQDPDTRPMTYSSNMTGGFGDDSRMEFANFTYPQPQQSEINLSQQILESPRMMKIDNFPKFEEQPQIIPLFKPPVQPVEKKDSLLEFQFKRVRNFNEDSESIVLKSSQNSPLRKRKKKKKTKKSRETSISREESVRNLEAIYLQRLEMPSQYKRTRFNSESPNKSMNMTPSLGMLSMTPQAADADLELIRKRHK